MTRILAVLLLAVCFSVTARADDATASAIQAAIADPSRSAKDVARDDNRRPLETLQFFGLKQDMRVIEIIPSGGWYTRILAPVLHDQGQLMVAIGSGRIEEQKATESVYANVQVLEVDFKPVRDNPFRLIESNDYDFGVTDVDMVLTFRNLHNLTESARTIMNKAAYGALKSGGIYGVVDHTARHMEALSQDNRRRLDPVKVIHEMQAIGFEFVDYADLHFHPDDALTLEVGNEAVSGQTDRFTLKFRKP